VISTDAALQASHHVQKIIRQSYCCYCLQGPLQPFQVSPVGEAARAAAAQQQGGQQLSDSKIRVVVRKRPINKKVRLKIVFAVANDVPHICSICSHSANRLVRESHDIVQCAAAQYC
jgi:hypothetical protein